jgi:hypothetical protein
VQQSDPVRPETVDGGAADPRDLGDALLGEGFPAFLHEDGPCGSEGTVPAPLHSGVDLARRSP